MFMLFFFFFNDTATTEIYTLSLHDALPISQRLLARLFFLRPLLCLDQRPQVRFERSEEHTSELQSRLHLVCRLLLEKKKNKKTIFALHVRLTPTGSSQSTRVSSVIGSPLTS